MLFLIANEINSLNFSSETGVKTFPRPFFFKESITIAFK
jgi:hypothetical protein